MTEEKIVTKSPFGGACPDMSGGLGGGLMRRKGLRHRVQDDRT